MMVGRLGQSLPLAMVATAAVIAVLGVTVSASRAATTPNPIYYLYYSEDQWASYDFTEQSVSQYTVDWPYSLLFWDNASINRVKDSPALSGEYPVFGGSMNELLNDGAGFEWDTDGGRKQTWCQQGGGRHYRVYAPPATDRMYNLNYGYWIMGTAHYDFDECFGTSWFGFSETAEEWIAASWERTYGGFPNTARNWSYAYNAEPYRVEGDHIWDNNGYATYLRQP